MITFTLCLLALLAVTFSMVVSLKRFLRPMIVKHPLSSNRME
jgi:hypothetical protein